jgi:hypothetical protein
VASMQEKSVQVFGRKLEGDQNGSSRETGCGGGGGVLVEWIKSVQGRYRWLSLVNTVMSLRILAPRS